MSDGWLYLENDEIKGSTRIPDDPQLREYHEARGWKVADPPDESGPNVPDAPQLHPEDETAPFVELYHPGIKARHLFPNNPGGLQAASEAGWRLLAADDADKPAKTTPAKKAAAKTPDRPATATDTKE